MSDITLPALELTPEDLKFDEENLYTHDKRNLDVIEMSLDEVGGARSIVIDENDKILAGNGTMTVAQRKGMKVVVVEGDHNTIVAVRRRGLTDYQKQRLALFDNRASDLHKADKKAVNRLVKKFEGQPILVGLFNDREQEKLLTEQANELELEEGGTDDPELQQPTNSKAQPMQSSVRMVQLYLTVQTQPKFVRDLVEVQRILQREHGFPEAKTITDQVLNVMAFVRDQLTESLLVAEEPDVSLAEERVMDDIVLAGESDAPFATE